MRLLFRLVACLACAAVSTSGSPAQGAGLPEVASHGDRIGLFAFP